MTDGLSFNICNVTQLGPSLFSCLFFPRTHIQCFIWSWWFPHTTIVTLAYQGPLGSEHFNLMRLCCNIFTFPLYFWWQFLLTFVYLLNNSYFVKTDRTRSSEVILIQVGSHIIRLSPLLGSQNLVTCSLYYHFLKLGFPLLEAQSVLRWY